MNPLRPGLRILLLLLLLFPSSARAHRLGDSVLRLRAEGGRVAGRVDIPLRDLALVLPLDPNADGGVTWAELLGNASALRDLVQRDVALRSGKSTLAWQFGDLRVVELAGEACASLPLAATPPDPAAPLVLHYRLLFEQDSRHRGLLSVTTSHDVTTAVLSPDRPTWEFARPPGGPEVGPPPAASSFHPFLAEGVHHIWIGTDHILFLLALLLPSVVPRRDDRRVVAAGRAGGVALDVVRTITAFTVAHSLTLALATLNVVRLPSRAVETVIAASVGVAALNNLVPFFRERAWRVAFGFGLIHGFGFASVLAELELPAPALVRSLLGFNLGVELGQLAIVAVFLPVAFLLRDGWFYRRLMLQGGSLAILVTAAVWAFERGTGPG